MCVTAAQARLAKTIVYAGVARRGQRDVHVMGYQNSAENLASGANCMLLHLPSAQSMGPDNMIDTTSCPTLLEDLARACQPAARSHASNLPHSVQVFHKGIYTVVLASQASLAFASLDQVPAARRPTISPALLDFYQQQFPGWHVALCCFENRSAERAQPLLWWYEPLYPDILLAPAIDAHDGNPPDLRAQVARDHQVIFGTSSKRDRDHPELWRLVSPDWHGRSGLVDEVRELMPWRAARFSYRGRGQNGDFLVPLDTLLRGAPEPRVGVLTRRR